MDANTTLYSGRLLRIPEVARRLGVTPGRVYQLIARRQIPSVKVGGALRVPEDAWRQWIDSQIETVVCG